MTQSLNKSENWFRERYKQQGLMKNNVTLKDIVQITTTYLNVMEFWITSSKKRFKNPVSVLNIKMQGIYFMLLSDVLHFFHLTSILRYALSACCIFCSINSSFVYCIEYSVNCATKSFPKYKRFVRNIETTNHSTSLSNRSEYFIHLIFSHKNSSSLLLFRLGSYGK